MAPSRSFMLLVALLQSHLVVVFSLTSRGSPPQWSSVGEPMQEQAGAVVEWATEAQQAAAKAGSDALKVQEVATKASGSLSSVLAKTGEAKAAMERTLADEKKISTLRDRIWQKAKQTAMAEIPKILPELRAKAQEKADEEAKKHATVFEKQMSRKAKTESAKAAKVYTDLMVGAGKSAAEYAKVGDTLITQATSMQMNAGLAQGQANAYVTVGDMSEAQRLLQQSRGEMNAAVGLNAQATGMYDTANKIASQLPAYADQASMAAYHAQVMYDPKAQPPSPPLVLTQK